MGLIDYASLPPDISPFERSYLKRVNGLALCFLAAHVPALMVVASVCRTGPLAALLAGLAVLGGPWLGSRSLVNPRAVSVVHAIGAMLMGCLLVYFGQGPVQIEMHFYYFAVLAIVCVFANPAVNIAAAVTVALHHGLGYLLMPAALFNYEARWWVVGVHTIFLVLETAVVCYISRQFFDNVVGLERIVAERSALLRQKEQENRLILDHVQQGLITIGLDGMPSAAGSAALDRWFGPRRPGLTLADWLGQADPSFADWFALGLESVSDTLLPPEIALAQLPSRLRLGERSFEVRCQFIGLECAPPHIATAGAATAVPHLDAAVRILVIVSDISERLQLETRERHQTETLQVFRHILSNRIGFDEFLAESDAMVKEVTGPQGGTADRAAQLVHTLKGNFAMFGMQFLSGLCHAWETAMAAREHGEAATLLMELARLWREARHHLEGLLGRQPRHRMEISEAELLAVLRALDGGADRSTLSECLRSWRLESCQRRLELLAQQFRGLADHLGKSHLDCVVEAGDLRLCSRHFAPFWAAFVHIVRNTLDHAVEPADQRVQQGKPARVSIRLTASISGGRFVLAVEDDGPGIDWEVLAGRARQLGLDPLSFADPAQVLFLPGISTRNDIGPLSGRGVGLAAVGDAVARLGGCIEVRSEPGLGASFRFCFPADRTVYTAARHAAAVQSPAAEPTEV